MCGVYGLIWREEGIQAGLDEARRAARAMRDSLYHRGPDGSGTHERDGVILGHLRLAIIDPEGGKQPMISPDGQVALSYNGECYNYPELMADLSARGWDFATRCDSETLLAGYCLQGEDFDERLNGMYAYALLDERGGRRQMLLSTDPVGIKPMFLYETGGLVLFSSELRAIIAGLRALGREIETDARALAAYLRLGWVPAPLTMVKGVRKLMPGERWAIDCDTCAARPVSVRDWPLAESPPRSEAEFDERFSAALKGAVKRQLVSDVPVGLFLSGGIDSSLLLAETLNLGHTMDSFTIRFHGSGHGVAAANEADIAREVADKLGSRFHCVDVDEATMKSEMNATMSAMDQPLADPACLPLLLLSRFARERVKVCLSGDGGDELFAGYPRHGLLAWRRTWLGMPGVVRALGRTVAGALPEAPGSGAGEVLRKLRVAHELISSEEYVTGPFGSMVAADRALEPWNFEVRPGISAMEADFRGQLGGQMLPKTDNMTMAASLECRVPLLDLELVSLAGAAPAEWKRRRGVGKLPLRRSLSRYLPREVTGRPKHGFRVPLTSWFRGSMADELRERTGALGDQLGGILPRGAVEAMVDDHIAGKAEHSIRIWTLLALDNWLARSRAA